MAPVTEIDSFRTIWNAEAESTARLFEALPADKYDFRPDPQGRSIGELAWHLAEIDGYTSVGLEQGSFDFKGVLPGLARPRETAQLAPAYRRVHQESMARLAKLTNDQLEDSVPFFDGRPMKIRQVLWGGMLYHYIHHRGQLSLLCRLAGGVPPGIYGPNREEMQAMRAERATAKA
jgi:uncharacterized damage-inducible protein DinB